jgi:ABC-type transport system involved in multi-copper enzyme maturation permease subunit
MSKVLAIARFTLLEALRTRLPWLTLAVLGGLLLASLLVQQLAITETQRLQTGFLAAGARLGAVFVLTLHVAGSMAREFNDKGVDLLLSLDLPRSGYYLGKLAGFIGIAVTMAALTTVVLALPGLAAGALARAGLALAPAAPSVALPLWGVSLACELTLIATLTLFCVITFAQIMPAVSFVAAFYLLGRSIAAIQLMSGSQLLAPEAWSTQVAGWLVNLLALLLPDLSRFTGTAWLLDGAGGGAALAYVAGQTLIYGALLAAAGLFDLYRKSL